MSSVTAYYNFGGPFIFTIEPTTLLFKSLQVGYRNSYYPITSFLFILVTSENYPSSVISIYIRSQLSRLALRTSAFNPVAARFPPNHVTNGPPTVPVSSRNYYPFARSKHRFEHVPQLIFQNAKSRGLDFYDIEKNYSNIQGRIRKFPVRASYTKRDSKQYSTDGGYSRNTPMG